MNTVDINRVDMTEIFLRQLGGSSELSPQSSLLSHFHQNGMHLDVVLHANWELMEQKHNRNQLHYKVNCGKAINNKCIFIYPYFC